MINGAMQRLPRSHLPSALRCPLARAFAVRHDRRHPERFPRLREPLSLLWQPPHGREMAILTLCCSFGSST